MERKIEASSETSPSRPGAGLGRRVLRARMEASADEPKMISQSTLGLLVGRRLGVEKGISGATVSRWEADESTPDLATVRAIAEVCRVDPGWLAFGEGSKAPGPDSSADDSMMGHYRRANMAILLSQERTREVEMWQKRKSKEWNTRLNRYQRRQRGSGEDCGCDGARNQRGGSVRGV